MKQMFQLIPRGSSNTMMQDKGVVKEMRKHCLVAGLILVLAISFGLAGVSADVSASESYVKPGNSVDLVFTGPPGSGFTVIVSDSRSIMDNVSLVFDGTGQYVWNYGVNETAYTDSIQVRATINGAVEETGFVTSRMDPALLAQTLITMATNSKKQAESALIEARKVGESKDEMLTRYREATQLLADSKGYAEQGEHTKAFEAIKTALTMFETIIEDTYSTDVAPTTPENERNKIQTQEALNDLTKRLTELNRIAENLEKNGFNVDALREGITRMDNGLEKAQNEIESNNMGEAARYITDVNESLKKVQDAITTRMREHNQRKVASYQTSLVNRYNTMRNTLTVMKATNTDMITGVIADMEVIEGKLEEARGLYEEGNFVESIRVLHIADRDFKEAFSGINGRETQSLLDSLDQLTVKLEGESSQVNRMRIQRQIDSVKHSLSNRLEMETVVIPRQPSHATP
jgi:hypothetical protein